MQGNSGPENIACVNAAIGMHKVAFATIDSCFPATLLLPIAVADKIFFRQILEQCPHCLPTCNELHYEETVITSPMTIPSILQDLNAILTINGIRCSSIQIFNTVGYSLVM